MTEQDIANALRAHLAGMADALPIIWENAPGVYDGTAWETPDAPFVAVSQVKTPPERFGLSDTHVHRGRLVASVMAREGDTDGFAATAEAEAEKIIARFPVNETLAAGDGKVRVIARPYGEDGYADGAYWRINVHVRWMATRG